MKKKVLLLLSGQLRTFDNKVVLDGWKKFFDKYDVTTYLCVWDNRGRSIMSKYANYDDKIDEDEIINLNQVKNIFQTNNIKFFNYNDWVKKDIINSWMHQYINDKFFNSIFASFYLKKQLFQFANKNEQRNTFDGVFLTRPDMFFLREPPDYPFLETNVVWQQNPPEIYFHNRIYDNFLFSNIENIEKICNLYGSDYLKMSIEKNYGTNLHFLDPCKILFSYFKIINLQDKSYDFLYCDPYREENAMFEFKQRFLSGNLAWCEINV